MAKEVKKLHLGCGLNTPNGWINVDGSWNAWLAKHPLFRKFLKFLGIFPSEQLDIEWDPEILIHDVRKPLPFPNNSIDAIYTSHLLEHLYLTEAKNLLKECFRVLAHNGVLRMVVPDLQSIILDYLREKTRNDSVENEKFLAADRLNSRLLLRPPKPPTGSIFYKIYKTINDYSHKWMYDSASLLWYFKQAGFVEVKEMKFHQSRIKGIKKIEKAGRMVNGAGICIEGVKPMEDIKHKNILTLGVD